VTTWEQKPVSQAPWKRGNRLKSVSDQTLASAKKAWAFQTPIAGAFLSSFSAEESREVSPGA